MSQIKIAITGTPFIGNTILAKEYIEPFEKPIISRQQKRKIERTNKKQNGK